MSNLTLPSGTGDARFMAFLKALRDELVTLKEQQGGNGGLEERLAALETTVSAETTGLVARVTALETPGA